MKQIIKYDESQDLLYLKCSCENFFEYNLSGYEIEYNEQFNEYGNIIIVCENCKKVTHFNSNIPLSEYEEVEFEEKIMPYSEINERKILRDILWNKRSDLKSLDRNLYNEEKINILRNWEKEKSENPTRTDIANMNFN